MGVDQVELARVNRGAKRGLSIGYDGEEANELVKALRRLPAALRKNIAAAVKEGASIVADDARELLRKTTARGRRYKVGPLTVVLRGEQNDGSKPGGPPAQQSGELRRSIRVKRARRDGLAYAIETEAYALFLEEGASGPGRRRLEPRPFLSTALENNRAFLEAYIAEHVARAVDEITQGADK